LGGVGFEAVGPDHVGGVLEGAAEAGDVVLGEGAELIEELAGGLLSLAPGPVGLVVFADEGGEGGDFGGEEAFEEDFGRGAGELIAGVGGDAEEFGGVGVGEVLADAEGGALGTAVGEGAAGSFEDGVEGGEEFGAGGGFFLAAGAFAEMAEGLRHSQGWPGAGGGR